MTGISADKSIAHGAERGDLIAEIEPMGKWADRLAAYQEQERLRQDLDLESAALLVSTMRSQGFTVRMSGEMIVVSPAPKITDEIRTLVRSLRPAILTVLSIERVRHPGAEK